MYITDYILIGLGIGLPILLIALPISSFFFKSPRRRKAGRDRPMTGSDVEKAVFSANIRTQYYKESMERKMDLPKAEYRNKNSLF